MLHTRLITSSVEPVVNVLVCGIHCFAKPTPTSFLREAPMMKRVVILLLTLTCCAFAQDKNSPQTLKGVLLEQLKTTHNVKDWFVPADIAVQGLTAEQANWTDGKGNHSVGHEVNHLVYWDNYELMKFKGETPLKFDGNNDETFNKFDSKQWTSLVKQLDDVMTGWEQAVQAADDKKVAEWASTIAHIGNAQRLSRWTDRLHPQAAGLVESGQRSQVTRAEICQPNSRKEEPASHEAGSPISDAYFPTNP